MQCGVREEPPVRRVLGCGGASAAEVLEQRAVVETLAVEAADVLESEEAFDALSAKDAQEAESLLKGVATSKQAAADVRAVCASFRSGVGPKPKRRKPVGFPGEADLSLDKETILELMPAEACRIYRDAFNGRWIGWYSHKGFSASKSWGPHANEYACVRDVLRRIWRHHMELTGEPCRFTGLL